MRNKLWFAASLLAVLLTGPAYAQKADWQVFAEPFIGSAHPEETNWKKAKEPLGRKPAVTGDVHRYGFPRSDLTVTLDGVTIKPTLALGGWIAFKPAHGGAMALGDLVLLETEVTPVVTKLTEGGF